MVKRYLYLLTVFVALGIFTLAVIERSNVKKQVAGITTSSNDRKISGIILPHHNLAKEYISASLERISKNQQFSTIVIIGPNHFEPQATEFISSSSVFDYPLQQEFIYKLTALGKIVLNQNTIEKEHSIMIPLSYLKFYFPETKFVPLIVPPYFERGEISQIAVFLSNSLPQDTLFVASVDFSHNTMLLEATAKNKETENVIKKFDFETLYQYKDDHLDSPASIGLLLSTMQRLGATNWELWYDSHGSLIEDEFTLQGTSYLIGVFSN